MPLSWNEIRSRAITFTKEWESESRERAEKDTFWNQFFNVFGISRKRVASFEQPVKKLNEKYGFIDLFWKGKLLVEHKSKGKDLDKAYTQALDYFHGLKERELPQYVLVSDFGNFKLYDLENSTENAFTISEFVDNIHLFGFIAGYEKRTIQEEAPVNIEAAEKMGKLHDRLKEIGYEGHNLEVYLVRLLFCLFADDTGIFNTGIFQEYIDLHTKEDGSDLAAHLNQLFQVLNTPEDKRLKTLNEALDAFPYVNGSLYEEVLPVAAFDSSMREILLDAGAMDWGEISPAIFGSMFQAALDPKERRNMGAHYTSEKNIMKVIKPLFLDELWSEFQRIKNSDKKLNAFHNKIATLNFLDPASCGSGNFLIITYRELRLLELEVLRALNKTGQTVLDINVLLKVSITQFYGIELDEFAAKVAEVGMWLIEHQMNEKLSLEFGHNVINLPLIGIANIRNANALKIEWPEVIPKSELNYILGNPPFLGKKEQSKQQKEDLNFAFNNMKGANNLDFVSGWFVKASELIQSTEIKVAFVSTNSITQGEQVGILWNKLLNELHIKINFAHRTFKWSNAAKGKAAVHVIIIGFSLRQNKETLLYDYEDINGEALEVKVKNINPYLVEGDNTIVSLRTKSINSDKSLVYGSFALDDGNYTLSKEEKEEILLKEPQTKKFIRPFIGGKELINNIQRFCIWIDDSNIKYLKESPIVLQKVSNVKTWRQSSNRANTKKMAAFPTTFAEIRQPTSDYIAIPTVSSERRKYIPIAYLDKAIIASNQLYIIPQGTVSEFGIITSEMHMIWVKYIGGKLKSDYRYSNKLIFNNFPFPKEVSGKLKEKVQSAAQKVLDVRKEFPDSSLADLYDPLSMPPKLVKAHQALDKAVDQCYRRKAFMSERERIEFLFELYEEYTQPLLEELKK